MENAFVRGLRKVLGLDRIEPAWRAEFAAQAYRVSAERAQRASWAVLLLSLPLFYLIDWHTYASGLWDIQPAHPAIFWWRAGLVVMILLLMVGGTVLREEPRRHQLFAWGSAIAYPLFGIWFTVVCQSLITDASIYVLFLIGVSVLFPMPTLLKLLIYPASFGLLWLGFQDQVPASVAAYYTLVDAACASVGALVTEAVAMRTYAADFAKSIELEHQRQRADGLLYNMLPAPVAERLKQDPGSRVELHEEVTVLFADFVGFGRLSRELPPDQMIGLLDHLFHEFDEAADRFGVEKIKTIGDAYMAASGVPAYQPDHARRAVDLALRMQSIAQRFRSDRHLPVHFRIGLHTGPAVAGIIGQRKYCYDLWGQTINTAAMLEATGVPDRIHISPATREAVGEGYHIEAREPVHTGDPAMSRTYFVSGRVESGESFKDRYADAAASR